MLATNALTTARLLLLALLPLAASAAPAQTPAPPMAATRGQLLYEAHCVACHTMQMHWRDGRLASDWDSLKAQVRFWQNNIELRWTDDDITAVARHLNDTVYRYPQQAKTPNRLGLAAAGFRAAPAGAPTRSRPPE